jgi:hypothetical protein
MRTKFDWWAATAQGSNPATAGSLARGDAQQANPHTSTILREYPQARIHLPGVA